MISVPELVAQVNEAYEATLQAFYQQLCDGGFPHWEAEYGAELLARQQVFRQALDRDELAWLQSKQIGLAE
ncbi:hypothetical protein [Almyronema epifaneia]|uniref:Uncharacterized protein n=1 Tax=Almyronema epifaneia S1 TaxID=2991925 RepID=A0ABW6IJZ8_9CYAN